MKTIKFRAWNKGLKKMHQNVGVHPHLMMSLMFEDDYYKEDTPGNYLFTPNGNNVVIQQYTGLKDKNNVEIYEDDILYVSGVKYKLVRHISGAYELYEVKENITSCTPYFLFKQHKILNVIGNIHENPELLN